jgi:hypothetical protein
VVHVSFARLEQHSNNVAHHVLQKATAGYAIDQPVVFSHKAGTKDGTDFGHA